MKTFLMQARSTNTGLLVTWVFEGDTPDNTGSEFPGPGAPEFIASTEYVGPAVSGHAHHAPVVVAVAPSRGSAAGSTHVVIQVGDSYLCTSAALGGVDLDNFAIDDATHVSGDTSAHAAGSVGVTVTNGYGTSDPLVGGYTFAPAPAVTGVDAASIAYRNDADGYNATGLQDPSGGNNIYITGTDFVNGCAVSFRQSGMEITSVSGGAVIFHGATAIEATCPPLPLGVYDIMVVNPDAQRSVDGNALHESFDPTVPGPTCLLLPQTYDPNGTSPGVGLWPDASGNANDALVSGSSPASSNGGAALGNPLFNGTTDDMTIYETLTADAGIPVTAMASSTAGTVVPIFRTLKTDVQTGSYNARCLISGSAASPNISHVASGLRGCAYDSGSGRYTEAISPSACSVGEVHVGAFTWNTGQIRTMLDGRVSGAVAAAQIGGTGIPSYASGNTGANTYVGRSYTGPRFQGEYVMLAIYPTELSDTTIKKIREWAIIMGYAPGEYFIPNAGAVTDAGNVAVFAGSSVYTTGTDVDLWPNNGGTVYANSNLAQTGAARPTCSGVGDATFGGETVLAFDGTQFLDSGTWGVSIAQPFTLYFVFIDDGTGATYVLDDIDGSSRVAFHDGTGFMFAGGGTPAIATPNGVVHIVALVFDSPSDGRAYVDNMTSNVATAADPGADSLASMRIGARFDGTGGFVGRLAFVGASVAAHDLAMRTKYAGYLAARYKLPITA